MSTLHQMHSSPNYGHFGHHLEPKTMFNDHNLESELSSNDDYGIQITRLHTTSHTHTVEISQRKKRREEGGGRRRGRVPVSPPHFLCECVYINDALLSITILVYEENCVKSTAARTNYNIKTHETTATCTFTSIDYIFNVLPTNIICYTY